MHAINFGEVYYDALRFSVQNAKKIFNIMDKLPIEILWKIDKNIIEKAGYYKTNFKMSYADSYVLAIGDIQNANIITTDHHEFDAVEEKTNLKFCWLR